MNGHPHGGSTRAVRVFVTVCFALWAALSYMALFALATVLPVIVQLVSVGLEETAQYKPPPLL